VDKDSSTVRVALIGCTGLLGDVIVTTLRAEPGLTVVASVPVLSSDDDIAAFDADIVVWNAADEQRIVQCLNGYVPPTRVLAITTDGQEAALWQLMPHRVELGALSPQSLVETIHGARVGPS
jgi:hypothetical protein